MKALTYQGAKDLRGGVVSVSGVYAGFIHRFLFGDAFDKGLMKLEDAGWDYEIFEKKEEDCRKVVLVP